MVFWLLLNIFILVDTLSTILNPCPTHPNKRMKIVSTVVIVLALVVGSSSAFQHMSPSISSSSTGCRSLNYDSNNNKKKKKNGSNNFSSSSSSRLYDTAQQMTEYLAKAHEEKLRAVKQAEAAKNAEIEVR